MRSIPHPTRVSITYPALLSLSTAVTVDVLNNEYIQFMTLIIGLDFKCEVDRRCNQVLGMLCHAMPGYAMPCHAMPCYAMPCYAMPCYAMLHSAIDADADTTNPRHQHCRDTMHTAEYISFGLPISRTMCLSAEQCVYQKNNVFTVTFK
jgi:hypothetical protein